MQLSNRFPKLAFEQYIFIILILLIPFLFWDGLRDKYAPLRYALICFISGPLTIAWIIRHTSKTLSVNFPPILYFLLSLLLFAGLSYFWSADPANTIHETIILLNVLFLFFIVVQQTTSAHYKQFLVAILAMAILGATCVSIVGIQQSFNVNLFNLVQAVPPSSFFGNRNTAATYLDLIIPVALILMLMSRKKSLSLLISVCLGVILTYLLIIYSRGSLLGLIITILFLSYISIKYRALGNTIIPKIKAKPVELAIVIIIPIIFVALHAHVIKQHKKEFFQTETVDTASATRLGGYINSLDVIKDKPLSGLGYGAFMLGFRPYMFASSPIEQAGINRYMARLHNDHLQMFVELGLPGGLLMITIIIYVLRMGWLGVLQLQDEKLRLICLGLILALIASSIHGVVDFPLHRPSSMFIFWLWSALIITLSYQHTPVKTKIISLKGVFAATTVIAFLSIYSIYLFYKHIEHEHYIETAHQAALKNDCGSAMSSIDKVAYSSNISTRLFYPLIVTKCAGSMPSESIIKYVKNILEYDPNNTLARLVHGYWNLKQNRLVESSEDFLKIIEILPHKAAGYLGIGRIALAQNQRESAIKLFRKAYELEPNDINTIQQLRQLNINPKE